MELNCIRLMVNDFDSCFRFYSETLGLKVTWGNPGGVYASFDIGLPSGLSIFKSDLMAEALGNADKVLPAGFRDRSAIIIKVADIDKTWRDLSSRGVKFLSEPKEMPGWGMTVAHFRDTEGNLLEIWSELPMEKWDKDLLEEAQGYQ
jgi:predicted enzyme related to lactoylglutathione lyase